MSLNTTSYETVLVAVEEGVATLTLNRPKVYNAFNETMTTEICAALQAFNADPAVRAVVITGAGKGFCSGQDLGEVKRNHESGQRVSLRDDIERRYTPMMQAIRSMPKPVIAGVNGVAAGAGFGLALACDLRVAASDASFICAFVRIGLVLDFGVSYFLPRIVGATKAAELAFLGEAMNATDAERFGLVNKVVSAEQLQGATQELARKLAKGPTRAIGLMKEELSRSFSHDLLTQLNFEADLQQAASETQDHREGVSAFLEKRPAVYKGA